MMESQSLKISEELAIQKEISRAQIQGNKDTKPLQTSVNRSNINGSKQKKR
jgi:hypothetical protein